MQVTDPVPAWAHAVARLAEHIHKRQTEAESDGTVGRDRDPAEQAAKAVEKSTDRNKGMDD